jgi:outer membrane protein
VRLAPSILYLTACAGLAALIATSSAAAPPRTPEEVAKELGYDLAQPLTLEQCTAIAMRVHPDLRAAVAQLRGALADLDRARSALWPSVSAGWDYTVTRTPRRTVNVGGVPFTTGGGETTSRNLAVNGVVTVYQTGRDATISQAKSLAQAAGAGLEDVRRELAYLVARSYFDLLATDRLVAAQEAGLAAADDHVREVQARIDAEDAAPVEIHSVRAQFHQAQLDLLSARNQAAIANANLRSALGGVRAALQVADVWQEPTSLPVLDECLATALSARPDLAQSRASLRAARLGLDLARQQRYPQLNLGASAEYGRYNGDTGSGWSVFWNVEQSLFDGGATRAGVDGAKADVEAASAQVARVELNVRLEVETAWLNVREAAERIAASDAARTEARANLQGAETRYAAGAGILLEVIDAQSRATTAEVEYISGVYGYNTSLADLRRAMGAEGGLPE